MEVFVFKHHMCSYHGCLNLPNIYKGPQPLFCIWVGLGIHPPAGFPEKKAGKLPGGSGVSPDFLSPFLCGKKGGASRHKRKEKRLFSMSAHNVRNPAERGVECAPPSFGPSPKRRQKGSRGFPRTPRNCPVFFSGKPAFTLFPHQSPYNKGARGPWVRLGAGMKNCSNPNPGAAGPFLYIGGFGHPPLPPAFLKRKPAGHLGLQGVPLGTSLPSFFV